MAGKMGQMASRPPRTASTVILAGPAGVLMVERARILRFLGGFHGCPGGVVDRGDAALPADSTGDGGKRAAALRELFEETGLLLTAGEGDPVSLPEEWKRLVEGTLSFADLLAGRKEILGTSRLVPAGNWLTPAFSTRRYDTFFYIVPVKRAVPVEISSPEAASCEWLDAGTALRRWKEHELLMVPPTLNMLRALRDGRGPDEWASLACAPPQARAVPTRRIESRFGLILFPVKTRTLPPATHTNTILFGEGEMIIIDPASSLPEEQEALLDLLADLDREGRHLKEIVLSHHHPDHVGGAEALRKATGVGVAAHPATALLLRGVVRIDRCLSDGDEIILAGPCERRLEVLHTPGHAPGHLSFHERPTATIFGGDNVLGDGSVLISPPHGDMDDYLRSLVRMKRLNARILVAGHGEIEGNPNDRIDACIEHRLERERMILASILDSPLAPPEIVKRVYTDVPEEMHPLAELSVLAHLARLVRRGLAAERKGAYKARAQNKSS